MTPYEFDKRARKLQENTSEYEALLKQFNDSQEQETKASLYRQRAINRILDLLQPIRGINRSKLTQYDTKQLIEIGKAVKTLQGSLSQQNKDSNKRYYSKDPID